MNRQDIDRIRENPNRTLLMVVNEVSKLFEDSMIKEQSISILKEKTARLILAHLSRNNGVPQQELVKVTQMKGSTVSIAISKMEAQGYLKRENNEYDMRSVRIFLTEKGRRLSDEVEKLLSAKDEKIMHGISEKDIKNAKYVLEKMLDNLIEE